MAGQILEEVLRQEGPARSPSDNGSRAEDYNLEHPIDATVIGLLIGRKLTPQGRAR